ncbi:unnamed protein product [Haemonchus placei]|uniref:Secreted protein n=1 Tax=Haemonchus placei TaxID=6290 RepID=A0A0N4XA50_HAEPC|nr:unnamed protein product [Haemonchus placei]
MQNSTMQLRTVLARMPKLPGLQGGSHSHPARARTAVLTPVWQSVALQFELGQDGRWEVPKLAGPRAAQSTTVLELHEPSRKVCFTKRSFAMLNATPFSPTLAAAPPITFSARDASHTVRVKAILG